ncbi:MAG: prolyl oligopeptidase family serine peptidase [Acidobacteriota bacterium]|nr:prolyl oligopeptidase family serine peptidase [Acidobacteriota bacterium]
MLITLLLGIVGIVGAPCSLAADEPKPAGNETVDPSGANIPTPREPWKPEDIIYAEAANQYRISPDNKWLVWVKSTGDKEKDTRISNLFLSSMSENREIQLTRGTDSVSQPRWSPDGEWIAFLSSKPLPGNKPDAAKMQIWLINSRGGEAYPLTELARAPRKIEWLDKNTLLYNAEEDPALYEQEQKRKKDDSEVIEDVDHASPVRLYKIAIKDKKITRLTNNTDWIENWGVSRDARYVAASHAKSLRYAFDQKIPPVIILYDLTTGQEKQILAEGRIRAEAFEWALDNSGFYVATPFSSDARFTTANITIVYFFDVSSEKATSVNLDWENGIGRDLQAVPGGFAALLAAGSHDEPAIYTKSPGAAWKREPLTGEHARNLEGFSISDDGKSIAYASSTAGKLPQLFRAQIAGGKLVSPMQITKLNESLIKGREYVHTEVIRWKGSNDQEVEGILYYPAKYEGGKKYPVITAIHGGPMGSDKDLWDESWAYPIQLLAQRGAFVLRPNYHGGNNYGLKWAESICCGKYYDLETPDINAGVDYLIAQGQADPERVATMGWSNGSILSTSLLVNYPERYKVASLGAGDIEWISDWGNVDFGQSFDAYYFGKSPLEDPELYLRKSPLFKLDKVNAPILIFHGSADRNVPPAQSWTYFRALQYYDKPVKFVVFPGEPHGPRKLTHQMRKVEEEIAWFDKYFFKITKNEDESVKPGSPLDVRLRTKTIARDGNAYGMTFSVKRKSVLIPEVVKRNALEVGRFEVTRAQFAAFDKNFKFESGTENYPANGVSFEQASAYAAWLSKMTGQTWRIPNETEVSSLFNKKDGENTLDYWAGYAPNPDDQIKIKKKSAELKGPAPLLRPVGSSTGQGKEDDELIFDLGGNVAEWQIVSGGKGKFTGGSADCPSDAKSNCAAAPEYVGFRVVRGGLLPTSTVPKATPAMISQ